MLVADKINKCQKEKSIVTILYGDNIKDKYLKNKNKVTRVYQENTLINKIPFLFTGTKIRNIRKLHFYNS